MGGVFLPDINGFGSKLSGHHKGVEGILESQSDQDCVHGSRVLQSP